MKKLIIGFTLLEVLVALAILAIALTAILRTTAQHIDNAIYLREKTIAHWVAMNVFTELQVTNQWLAMGESSGKTAMAKQEWYWKIRVSATPDPELRRIEIQVKKQADDKEAIEILVGFLGLYQSLS